MIERLLLPTDRFATSQLSDLKQKNFIYGKNGSGKSSITNEIIRQYSDLYDIRVFQGFDSVAENSRLKAISLGKENAELQPQIESLSSQISDVEKDLAQDGSDNFYQKYLSSKTIYESHREKFRRFYSQSASQLKNNYTELTGPNYNTKNFQSDIQQAQKLTEEAVDSLVQIMNQQSLPVIKKQSFDGFDLSKYIEETNAILETELVKTIVLDFNSPQEQNWVREGLKLHSHTNNNYCIFCANEIPKDRLDNLNNFFGDKVKQFESQIQFTLKKIENVRYEIEKIRTLNEKEIYPKFHHEVNYLNFEIRNFQIENLEILDILIQALGGRLTDLFTSKKRIEVNSEVVIADIKDRYLELCDKNDTYTRMLSEEKSKSINNLRLHQVAILLEGFDYNEQVIVGRELKKEFEVLEKEFQKKSDSLKSLNSQHASLISQSVDESYAAEEINKKLERLGSYQFKLVLVDDEQKGQYIIENLDGTRRNIETLSTGEKNIVAFLWFISDLNNPEKNSSKEKIIVFDDPMNSNDDSVQYLIILQLQKLLKNLSQSEQIFILTHNIHFYLNVRYKWWRGSRSQLEKKNTLHIFKVDGRSSFRTVSSEDDDLMTSYQALWNELHWLYEQQKPDFMLNPIRRIMKTYLKFNKINSSDFYEDFDEIEKLFNVNSHSIDDIDDFETNANGKTPDEIIDMMRQIFRENGGENHFNSNWNKELVDVSE